jgi:competence protein CoiA
MLMALVDNKRTKPSPNLRGVCPFCSASMVARCGKIKIWHWAHKAKLGCDPWWENETEWHRQWKNQFPVEWQEVIQNDPNTGEKHIADVKTENGLVVEFQHSPMKPEELESREIFYKDMVWIIDGLRNDLDLSYFQMGLGRQPIQKNPLAYGLVWLGKGKLFHNWSEAKAKVFIDFGNNMTNGTHVIWRLIYFDQKEKTGAVAPYRKDRFIETLIKGDEIGVPYLPEESDK